MDTKATRALIEQFVDAWVNEEIAKLATLMSDDVVWVLPVSVRQASKTMEGREEVVTYREEVIAYLNSGSEVKPGSVARSKQKLVVDGDTGVWFHHLTSELVRGGTYYNDYAWRLTCADGKVTRIDEYVDTLHSQQQLADLPETERPDRWKEFYS